MKIPKVISFTLQNHAKKPTAPSTSLSGMVDNIIRKDNFYEGESHLVIDKIISLKNSAGADGMMEIQEAWAKIDMAGKKAKHKIDKYFKLGMRADKQKDSSPSEQSLPTKKIQTDLKENTLDKVTERKLHSDDLPNNSIKEKQLNQPGLSEKQPEFQKILASHTIEEAIKIKLVFNKISDRSLNLIEGKIKKKFKELTLSKNPELFEEEMINAQKTLKKYDNELVCNKLNVIINKYLDKYDSYIRESKSPMARIYFAINSVSNLQDITSRKFNEFKMAIIDGFKREPIENIEKYSSDLMRKISNGTHQNIAKKINDFIEIHSMDRINELKGDKKISVESTPELLEPQKNIDTEELMKEISLKKIISHVFNRIINNIRTLFSRN